MGNLLRSPATYMAPLPRITLVTPSYNQGKFIGRTIDSVLAQNYPNLEYIIVDGMSTDETPRVLARYPHLQIIREPDHGQAAAINKGFRRATGAIYGFLNSDDTLVAGALHQVAREIDPARGRHVIVGRCLYIDENDQATGQEHPCAFSNHERVLQVWRGHCIPQPATFWTAAAWRCGGPLDEREQLVPDYDLMCRLSRRFRFHIIDQVLATYRLHSASKTCSTRGDDICRRAVEVSRRYWGAWWSPRYWQMRLSLALLREDYPSQRKRRAAALMREACEARATGRHWRDLICRVSAATLAPETAWRRWLLHGRAPRLRRLSPNPRAAHTWQGRWLAPLATRWRSFTDQHSDGYVGPRFCMPVCVPPAQRYLHLDGTLFFPSSLPEPLVVVATLDGQAAATARLTCPGPFSLAIAVSGLSPGPHALEVVSSWFMVPDDFWGNSDFRPLAFHLAGMRWSEMEQAA